VIVSSGWLDQQHTFDYCKYTVPFGVYICIVSNAEVCNVIDIFCQLLSVQTIRPLVSSGRISIWAGVCGSLLTFPPSNWKSTTGRMEMIK